MANPDRHKLITIVDRFDTIQDTYYGGDGKLSELLSSVSQEDLDAGLGTVSNLIQIISDRKKSETKKNIVANCGRRPLFGQMNKARYQQCADKVNTPLPTAYQYKAESEGANVWAIIGITAAGIAVIGGVVYAITKRTKVQTQPIVQQ
jgi:hypothetical protein